MKILRMTSALAVVVVAVTALSGTPAGSAPPTPEGCLSINGEIIYDDSTSTCDSAPSVSNQPNVARATNGGWAVALVGSGNYAEANGPGAHAGAGTSLGEGGGFGDKNHAVANGPRAIAEASKGDRNRAVATGETANALAGSGNGNRAVAIGDIADAQAGAGDKNRAEAIGDSTRAFAVQGSKNRALDTLDDGKRACAGNGDDKERAVNEDLCI